MTGVDPVNKGDKLFITVENTTGTANITLKHANFTIVELIS